MLHYGPIQPFFLNTANLSHLSHPPHPRPPRPSAWMTLRVTCAGRRIMIVYTAAAALRLGRVVVVVVVVRHSDYDRPCDVMKRQFVLLSLSPSLAPRPLSFLHSVTRTWFFRIRMRARFSSSLLSSVSFVTAFGHIRKPILQRRERGDTILITSESRALRVRKSLPENFYLD